MPPKVPKAPKVRPPGHRPTTRHLHRLVPGIHVLYGGLPAVTRPRPAPSPVVELVDPSPSPPTISEINSDISEFDLGPAAVDGPLASYIESHAGGYVNFHPRSREEERRAELGRRRARTRRMRNAGVGSARRRWAWRNGKGGKGKRRERRRDQKGRFI